jgi:hypothetical protein
MWIYVIPMANRKNQPDNKISWKLFSEALSNLRSHEPLQIARAASFFAVFALPAMLIILSALFSSFSDEFTIREDLLKELSLSIDKETITQVSKTVTHVWLLPLSMLAQILGFIFLLFVATTFFAVIKGSLNQLWDLRSKKEGIAIILVQRIKSLAAIIIAGTFVLIIVTINKMDVWHGQIFLERMINFSAGAFFLCHLVRAGLSFSCRWKTRMERFCCWWHTRRNSFYAGQGRTASAADISQSAHDLRRIHRYGNAAVICFLFSSDILLQRLLCPGVIRVVGQAHSPCAAVNFFN